MKGRFYAANVKYASNASSSQIFMEKWGKVKDV